MSNVTEVLLANELQVTHKVGPNEHGWRLDHFLKSRYPKRSREHLKSSIDSGIINIHRNTSPHLHVGKLKPSTLVLEGDEVFISIKKDAEPPVSFDYSILYEDAELLILNKPAQLPVHPAGSYYFNTLLIHLRTDGFTRPMSAEREYFLTHRIDKETSGVLVLAKSKELNTIVSDQFADRTTEKRYLAIVRGRIPEDAFTIDSPLCRRPGSKIRLKMYVAGPEDTELQTAVTKVRVLERRGNFTLVECAPLTGRQHQIRVHLDSIGFPLVGDKLYGIPEDEAIRFFEPARFTKNEARQTLAALGAPIDAEESHMLPPRLLSPELRERLHMERHALHAASIRFTHPKTGAPIFIEAPLTPDLKYFWDSLLTSPEAEDV